MDLKKSKIKTFFTPSAPMRLSVWSSTEILPSAHSAELIVPLLLDEGRHVLLGLFKGAELRSMIFEIICAFLQSRETSDDALEISWQSG